MLGDTPILASPLLPSTLLLLPSALLLPFSTLPPPIHHFPTSLQHLPLSNPLCGLPAPPHPSTSLIPKYISLPHMTNSLSAPIFHLRHCPSMYLVISDYFHLSLFNFSLLPFSHYSFILSSQFLFIIPTMSISRLKYHPSLAEIPTFFF